MTRRQEDDPISAARLCWPWRLVRRTDEAIAEAALGADVAGPFGVIAQFVPQATHVDPDIVDLVDVFPSPDLRQQRAVGENAAGVANEMVKQLVLGRRQLKPLAAQPGLLGREVHLQVSGLERRGAGLR